jgi:FtsH-binding integral membrane protein
LITQIPILSSPYLVYDLCSGLSAKLSCSGSNFGITAFFGTQLQFFIGTQRPWGVGLNLVAIALLILVRKQMKTEPNQTPEPTPTAVTPPAGQESRQP